MSKKKSRTKPTSKIRKQQPQKNTKKKGPLKPNPLKRILLFFISLVVTFGFLYILPKNKNWINQRIIPYAKMIPQQAKKLDVETRKKERWGYDYSIYNFINNQTDSSSVFLVPPQKYLVRNLFSNKNQDLQRWVYPSSMYYHCEYLNMVDLQSDYDLLKTATHTLWVDNGQLKLMNITDSITLNRVLAEFRKDGLGTFHTTGQIRRWLEKTRTQ